MKKSCYIFLRKFKSEIFVLFLFLLILGLFFNYVLEFGVVRSNDQGIWGQFGDYFGGILNPILSFCAFVGLMLTLRFQNEQALKAEQRHSLEQFDARFFQLLGLIGSSLSISRWIFNKSTGVSSIVEGYPAVQAGASRLREAMKNVENSDDELEIYKKCLAAYDVWASGSDGLLSYFQTVLCAIDYVIRQENKDARDFSLNILISQLPLDSRVILFYLLIFGEYFSLFRHLDKKRAWGDPPDDELFPHQEAIFNSVLIKNGGHPKLYRR